MRKAIAWVAGTIGIASLCLVLNFGAQQAFASHQVSASAILACDQWCPQNEGKCNLCCQQLGATGGSCEGEDDELCECFL